MTLALAVNSSHDAQMRQLISLIDESTCASENTADTEWMSQSRVSIYGETRDY